MTYKAELGQLGMEFGLYLSLEDSPRSVGEGGGLEQIHQSSVLGWLSGFRFSRLNKLTTFLMKNNPPTWLDPIYIDSYF